MRFKNIAMVVDMVWRVCYNALVMRQEMMRWTSQ